MKNKEEVIDLVTMTAQKIMDVWDIIETEDGITVHQFLIDQLEISTTLERASLVYDIPSVKEIILNEMNMFDAHYYASFVIWSIWNVMNGYTMKGKKLE